MKLTKNQVMSNPEWKKDGEKRRLMAKLDVIKNLTRAN